MTTTRPLLFVALAAWAALLAMTSEESPSAFFENDVLVVLEDECFRCHGGKKKLKGGLRLTSRIGVLKGGDSGPSVELGDPDASLLLKMIRYGDPEHQMPPGGKLPDEQIATLERWVRQGIPWSGDEDYGVEAEEEESPVVPWAYGPLERPMRPRVRDAKWVVNPIDAFVKAKLEATEITPAEPASKTSLLRRVTYDLTGLPPTPEEVEAFRRDESPKAYENAIERLLASPHYGERWARHWLDVVRYAETNGFERDSNKPFIWRYRDYVIDAFNADKPYDRFIMEQLAGDELDEVTPETIVATSYQRLMQWDDEPGQGVLQARYDTLDDLVSTTSQAFLGATLGCARCHDHKKDPIPQADYYRFMSFFHGLTEMRADGPLTDIPTSEERAEHDRLLTEKNAELAALEKDLTTREGDFRRKLLEHDDVKIAAADLTRLKYRFYRDTWNRLPEFDDLRPEETGRLPAGLFDLSVASRSDSIGFVFEGRLRVRADGEYRFVLDSDDGARLTVNGEAVIDYDGTHGLGQPREATVTLKAGHLPIRLDYFQGGGGYGLKVWWQRVPAPTWRYTFEDPGPGWEKRRFDDSGWSEGPSGFGTHGTPASEIGTVWNTKDVWMRRTFDWNGADRDALTFVGHQDDDIQVYVNGTPAVQRTGYVTSYGELPPSDEARRAIRHRENLLAVHCEQDFGGQYVHVEPAHIDDVGRAAPADLAFGRRPLSLGASFGSGGTGGAAIHDVIAKRGPEVWSGEEVKAYHELRKQIERVRRRDIPMPRAFAVLERGPQVEPMHVHIRGSAHAKGEPVEPSFPQMLGGAAADIPPPSEGAKTSGRRRVLATWIASEENPMTARVMANRIWQHHFGRGIVKTPNDFGALGEGNTHPALLDWLAAEFVAREFSVKAMHRLILTSNTYLQSTHAHASAAEKDPGNDLFSRFALRRLSAEEMRDSMLAMTGRLNPQVGGPPFYSRMPQEALDTASRPDAAWGKSPEDETFRRSIYIKVKRSLLTPILSALDLADTDATCPVRFTTTQPTQALTMVNGDFVREMADRFAARLREEAGDSPAAQVRRALELALGRSPRADEITSHVMFMRDLAKEQGVDALALFCLVVLNLNEYAYLD